MSTNTKLKDAAIDFLQLTAAGRIDEAFARHAGPAFRHHNPWFASDAATIQVGMKDNAARFPNMEFEVQRALADGDQVAVHSRARMMAGMPSIAVVHILRFEDGKIAEMWDVAQPEPVPMANEIGMF